MKRVFLVLFNLCVDLFLSLRDKIFKRHKIKQARKFQREILKSVRHAHSCGIGDDLIPLMDCGKHSSDWYREYCKYVLSCHIEIIGPYQFKKEKGNMK